MYMSVLGHHGIFSLLFQLSAMASFQSEMKQNNKNGRKKKSFQKKKKIEEKSNNNNKKLS